MPGSQSYDKLAFFTTAINWAKRLRDAAYPEAAANLYVQANRGKGVAVTALTSRLARKGVPRCNAACQLSEVRWEEPSSRPGRAEPTWHPSRGGPSRAPGLQGVRAVEVHAQCRRPG